MHRRQRNYKAITLLWLAGVFMTLFACNSGEKAAPIELPATSALVLQTNWGIITSSHLRLRESPSTRAPVLATLWKGSVLEIVSKTGTKETVEDQEDFWYQISYDGLAGWVFGAYLDLYEYRNRAEEFSRELQR